VLHAQARAALEQWAAEPRIGDGLTDADVARMRADSRDEAAREPREPVASVLDVDAGGVPCRLYRDGLAAGVALYVHGGGFVFGDLETHDAQCRRVARRTGLAVLAVDYRRPPEHRFPAAPDDVDTALTWLRREAPGFGLDPGRVVALGDSAGGNLALVAALRNPGAFAATVLVYPFLDPTCRHYEPWRENVGLTRAESAWYWEQYAAGPDDLADPDLAPLGSSRLGTLPPTLVLTAEHDVLHGEDVALVRGVEAGGGTVALSTYDGMVHGFWTNPALFDAAEESLEEIAGFLRETV
jgi:acetyl esterase